MNRKWLLLLLIPVTLLIVLGIVFLVARSRVELYTSDNGKSVSIIGGADGPTAIFIAGKVGGSEVAEYTQITMEMAKTIFEQPGDYIILDVRRADEYEQGHIPGAINVANESIIDIEPEELPDKDQTIYVYCRSGVRSRQASEKLVAMGYTHIIDCGGFINWTGEVEK